MGTQKNCLNEHSKHMLKLIVKKILCRHFVYIWLIMYACFPHSIRIIFSVSSSDTCLFDHSADIIHLNIFDFCAGQTLTYAACTPSKSTSEAINQYTTEA